MPTVNLNYAAEAEDIARRRKMAEMLQQQALEPIKQETAGGYVVPISWTQGLAKALQGGVGAYQQGALKKEAGALSDRYNAERGSTLAAALKAGEGQPAKPEQWMSEGTDERMVPAQDAVSPDRTKTFAALAASQFPDLQALGTAEMLKQQDSPWAKVDPKDYTPASVQEFGKTRNFASLVPVRKMEVVNAGGSSQVIDPYAVPVGQVIPHTLSPDTAYTENGRNARWQGVSGDTSARLGQEDKQWRGLSAFQSGSLNNSAVGNQIAASNAGNTGLNTQFNTGTSIMPPRLNALGGGYAPSAPSAPQGSPQFTGAQPPLPVPQNAQPQPIQQPAPQVQPSNNGGGVITPKMQSEIAGEQEKARRGAQSILQAIHFDPAKKTDDISNMIRQSTSGIVQNAVANAYGAVTGNATSGREAIGKLTTEANKMTMDLMGGKLGTGISNADRDFITAQLGDVGNANIPANERLAAWNRAMERLTGVASGAIGGQNQGNVNNSAPVLPPASPQDRQALQWANANRNDPRAAAIKQRLGR